MLVHLDESFTDTVALVTPGNSYLTPLPAYLTNSHPDTHFHMLFVGVHREPTHDDVTKLPIAPIYCFFVAIMTSFLWAAAIETADRMGLTKRKGLPFPHQPHLFGTAPNWLIRTLTDLRWHPSNSGGVPSARSDLPRQQGGDNPPNFLTKMHPRNLYLFVILLASTPLPLMVFGAGGSGETTLWWTLTPLVIGTLLTIEGMIHRSQRDAASLDGMRYNYKGA